MSKKDVEVFISVVFASRDFAHKSHLGTHSYAQHIALGSFYDDIVGLGDSLVEAWQGRHFELLGEIPDFKTSNKDDPVKVLKQHLQLLEESRDDVAGHDTALQNIIDEIVSLYLSTLYKLHFLK